MSHATIANQKLDSLQSEHKSLQTKYYRTSKDLLELRKREEEFNNVLANQLKWQVQIDDLTALKDRLVVRNDDLKGKNQVFESELTVIKKEILKERRAQNDLQKLCEDKNAAIHDLKGKLIDQELECGDRDHKIQRLTNQKLILEKKLDECE